MSLFEKIGYWLGYQEKEKSPIANNGENPQSGKNMRKSEDPPKQQAEPHEVENKEEVLRNICGLINKLSEDLELGTWIILTLWLDMDLLNFKTYDTEQYRQRILGSIKNECGVMFGSVKLILGRPSEELRCTPVGSGSRIFLQLTSNPQTQVIKKAVIAIFGNAGSLKKEKYVLSADEMKEKRIPAYNIGIGEFPKMHSGFRKNHIAIDDDTSSNMIDKNKFVSRTHAHIGYSDKCGFYLQVEREGTRLMGKRTRIFRGDQIIEMDNIQVKEPLQNGDLIELGKAVVLQYTEIKD